MVVAQQIIASQNGCDVIRDVVSHVTPHVQSDGTEILKLTTDGDSIYYSRNVLVATNVSTGLRDLLGGVCPEYEARPQTVTLAEVSQTDARELA
jgi:hypothetical protein